MDYQLSGKSVFVAGHKGLVGSAVLRRLRHENCTIITAERTLDLRAQADVSEWFASNRPDAVILAAAKVGGIVANSDHPAEFLYDNLMIASNVINSAKTSGVDKLVFLGSSCIYPKMAPQPIFEDSLLSGPLEPTNEWYAIAKIAGIKLCQAYRREYGCNFISAMPTNLYGPGDNFDLATSHVLPALMRKAHEAKLMQSSQIEIWGTGEPRREFMHVDDLADALIFLLKHYSDEQHINIGTGTDISIHDLATLVCDVVGVEAEITRDLSKPDGTPQKLMSNKRISSMGWRPKIDLRSGVEETYNWFKNSY